MFLITAAILAASVQSIPLPCEPFDEANPPRVLAAARLLAPMAKIDRPLSQCTVYAGSQPIPVLQTMFAPDGTFVFVVAREIEEVFSDSAIRGVIGHELGHLAAGDHQESFWRALSGKQKLEQEAQADTAALGLVGRADVISAVREFLTLHESMLMRHRTNVQQGLVFRYQRLMEPVSEDLTAVARDIAAKAGLTYQITVLVPEEWRTKGRVNAMTNVSGQVVTIRVSPILVDELDVSALRAVLAHELAHPQGGCGPKYANTAAELACEHKADALSAKWVGRTAALRTLCLVMTISFDWRDTTDASAFIERIRLLHERTEIP